MEFSHCGDVDLCWHAGPLQEHWMVVKLFAPVTLILTRWPSHKSLTRIPWRCTGIWTSYIKAFESYRVTDRHTDGRTESTKIINLAALRVVKNGKWYDTFQHKDCSLDNDSPPHRKPVKNWSVPLHTQSMVMNRIKIFWQWHTTEVSELHIYRAIQPQQTSCAILRAGYWERQPTAAFTVRNTEICNTMHTQRW